MAGLRFADVAEGVRRALATYCHALDDGRTDDVVATFCPDGGADLPGLGTPTGSEALRSAYARWVPRRPQRHVVANTELTSWTDDEATAVSDVVLLLRGPEAWEVRIVGRYHDVLHRAGDTWRFHHRRAVFEE